MTSLPSRRDVLSQSVLSGSGFTSGEENRRAVFDNVTDLAS
jgi:hypothetical protein